MDGWIWIRVGDAGEYVDFDGLGSAIDYLNDLRVGQITGWVLGGFDTPNYYGHDYISIYWGGHDASFLANLDRDEQEYIESGLEESYL
jgi:hypothetical protein